MNCAKKDPGLLGVAGVSRGRWRAPGRSSEELPGEDLAVPPAQEPVGRELVGREPVGWEPVGWEPVGWEPGEPIPKVHPKRGPVGHVGRVRLVAQVPGGCPGKGLAGHVLVHRFVASGLGERCEGNETKN